jgi:formate/nitrite transporter FocA (FNT family)
MLLLILTYDNIFYIIIQIDTKKAMPKIAKLISPIFFGCGVSLMFYGSMNNLPV